MPANRVFLIATVPEERETCCGFTLPLFEGRRERARLCCWVDNKFHGSRHNVHPESPSNKTQIVRSRREILRLLRQLVEDHSPLTVHIADAPDPFLSALLAVESQGAGRLVMNGLNSAQGHKLLLETRWFHVRGQVNGVTLGFQGRLESVHQEERGPFYHLTIPDVVHYGQRRNDYRVPVGLGLHGRVTLIATDGEAIEGRLCNLSQSGACVMFPVTAELAAEMRFDLCVIELPEVAPVQCSAEVRRVAEKNAPPELMAGLLFLDTDPQQRRQLRNSVAALERELIKKQSATPRR